MKPIKYFIIMLLFSSLALLLMGEERQSCEPHGYCGDGKVNPLLGEQCDLGYESYCERCVDCKRTVEPYCGDGHVCDDEECDFGYTGFCNGCIDCSWYDNVCGDGYQCDAEQCDDGNLENGDGCSAACEIEHDMIHVPAGSFIMSDPYLEEIWGETQHEVTLTHDFYMDRAEVTNRKYCWALQWAYNQGYVDATFFTVTDPSSGVELIDLEAIDCEIRFLDYTFEVKYGRDDYPALRVSWYGSASYCDWLSMMEDNSPLYDRSDWSCAVYRSEGYRLPTEAEWEFAAQYDDERIYPWGDEEPTCDHANFNDEESGHLCIGFTTRVCNYPLGYSALGFCDLAGNVREWVNDWWGDLPWEPQIDPLGPDSGAQRVKRNGSWNKWPVAIRCSYRFSGKPDNCYNNVGFRAAKIGGGPRVMKRTE